MRSDRFKTFAAKFGGCPPRLAMASGEYSSDWRVGAKASGDVVEILMHDAIGDSWVGLDSRSIAELVRDNKGKKILCDINSFGGSAYDGIAIYNAFLGHDAEITAKITGIAYSAASIIPMAADTVVIAENGTFGIHPAWLFAMGNQYALRDTAKWLEGLDANAIDTYAARCGLDRSQVETWYKGENNDGTFFTGKEAVQHGFADALIPLKKRKSADDDGDNDHTMTSGNSGSRPSAEVLKMIEQRKQQISERQSARAAAERLSRLQQIAARGQAGS